MINPYWIDAIHYLVYYPELSAYDIAEKIGVSHQTIYNWKNVPEFREIYEREIDNKLKHLRNKIEVDATDIYNRMYSIAMNSTNESAAFNASKYILDQVLGKAVDNIDIKNSLEISNRTDKQDILDVFEGSEE